MAARTTPAFRATVERLHAGVRTLTGNYLRRSGLVPAEDVEIEAERFAALVAGLGLVIQPVDDGASTNPARASGTGRVQFYVRRVEETHEDHVVLRVQGPVRGDPQLGDRRP
jgi:hypothetical protein